MAGLAVFLFGCERVDCTPIGAPDCAAAAVCCPFQGDSLAGDCHIQSECNGGECGYPCDRDDCLAAFDKYVAQQCE